MAMAPAAPEGWTATSAAILKLRQAGHTKGFDDGLLRARSQSENYARALPAAESRPPFVLVVDVGTVIEVYAEFS